MHHFYFKSSSFKAHNQCATLSFTCWPKQIFINFTSCNFQRNQKQYISYIILRSKTYKSYIKSHFRFNFSEYRWKLTSKCYSLRNFKKFRISWDWYDHRLSLSSPQHQVCRIDQSIFSSAVIISFFIRIVIIAMLVGTSALVFKIKSTQIASQVVRYRIYRCMYIL